MIISILHRLAWTLMLLTLQVFVLNQIHPGGWGAPLLCPLAVIILPLGTSRAVALLWGFALGFVTDIFAGTIGIGSAAMTFIALLQPPLLQLTVPRDSEEEFSPSFVTMGRWNYLRFMALLFLLHHIIYFALEGFSYFRLTDIAISMSVSYAASMLIAIIVETIRNPKR